MKGDDTIEYKIANSFDASEIAKIQKCDWSKVIAFRSEIEQREKIKWDRIEGKIKPEGRIVSFTCGNVYLYRNHFDWFPDGNCLVSEKVKSIKMNGERITDRIYDPELDIFKSNNERFCDTLVVKEFLGYTLQPGRILSDEKPDPSEKLCIKISIDIIPGKVWVDYCGVSKNDLHLIHSLPTSPIAKWEKLDESIVARISEHNQKCEALYKEREKREEAMRISANEALKQREEAKERLRKKIKLNSIKNSGLRGNVPPFFSMTQAATKLAKT
jgi:hypothetical protein